MEYKAVHTTYFINRTKRKKTLRIKQEKAKEKKKKNFNLAILLEHHIIT